METSRKVEEDISIIKAVMERTRCDICEVANYFIWTWVIYMLLKAGYLLIGAPLESNETTYWIRLIRSVMQSVLPAIPFFIYYRMIRLKENSISNAVMLIWGVITILIPFFLGLVTFFSYRNSIRADMVINELVQYSMEDSTFFHTNMEGVLYVSHAGLVEEAMKNVNYQMIAYIVGIFIIGFITGKRNVKRLGMGTLIVFFALECVCLYQVGNMTRETYDVLFYAFMILFGEGALLILGIFLKLEQRKKIQGVA